MIGTIEKFDHSVFLALYSWGGRNAVFDYLIINLGEYIPYLLLLFLAGMAGAGFIPRFQVWREANAKIFVLAVFSALLARFGAVPFIRLLFERTRPFEILPIANLIAHETGGSFPSGHAAASFAIAAALWRRYPRLSIVFYILSIFMGVARIIGGVHWPSDILVGAAVGMGAVWILRKLNTIIQFHIQCAPRTN